MNIMCNNSLLHVFLKGRLSRLKGNDHDSGREETRVFLSQQVYLRR